MSDRVPLGMVASVKSGFAFKSKDWKEDGVPVIKIANVKDGFVSLDGCSFVDEEVARGAAAFELKSGDILISMTGYIGEVAKVRNEGRMLLNQRVGKFSIKSPSKLDRDFLFYCLRDPELKAKFVAHAYGAAQPNISPTLIEKQEIALPPLTIQQRIADILSAYDELIENSQRRIKILESMARALYREWFVHFRFPGHESVPRVPSPLGEIPQGWEVARIDEALAFESGKTIKKEERENGETPVYGANGIIGSTSNLPMASNGIIMGKIGSCGALHRSPGPCWVTNNAFLVRPAAIQSWELAWLTLSEIDFKQYVGGAANPYMPINAFGQHEVLIPPVIVQAGFEERLAPLRGLVETLSERIQNLRRTRDLLLPRLLSGQIDVETMPS